MPKFLNSISHVNLYTTNNLGEIHTISCHVATNIFDFMTNFWGPNCQSSVNFAFFSSFKWKKLLFPQSSDENHVLFSDRLTKIMFFCDHETKIVALWSFAKIIYLNVIVWRNSCWFLIFLWNQGLGATRIFGFKSYCLPNNFGNLHLYNLIKIK